MQMTSKERELEGANFFYNIMIESVDELRIEFEEIEAYEQCGAMVDLKNSLEEKLNTIHDEYRSQISK